MSTVVVRYRPRPGEADRNQRLVEAVFEELNDARPDGIRYATFRLEDGTFIHIAAVEVDPNPLTGVAAFAACQDGIFERCETGEGPNPQPAELVGSYRLLASDGGS